MSYIDLLRRMIRRTGRIHLPAPDDAMLPLIQPDDTLQVALLDEPANLAPGQIVVVVRNPSHYSIGRVTSVTGGMVHLASDNRPSSDVPVLRAQALGRVTAIIRNGHYLEIADSTPFSTRAPAKTARANTEIIPSC